MRSRLVAQGPLVFGCWGSGGQPLHCHSWKYPGGGRGRGGRGVGGTCLLCRGLTPDLQNKYLLGKSLQFRKDGLSKASIDEAREMAEKVMKDAKGMAATAAKEASGKARQCQSPKQKQPPWKLPCLRRLPPKLLPLRMGRL